MKKSAVLLMGLLAISGGAFAAGDAAAGKAKSGVCAACHGGNGISMLPGYPSLAGQKADYLEKALKAYKNKQRTSPQAMIMQPQAAMLSEADISNLAAYYNSL
ncbi:cytochrome C biogenesis protein CcsB [Endozoicomonas sp. OPT23]|uniref:c-type cytochrome n=1 Tax=Endozoicomonas sp. OPT23 TaxID=2072845 RepID=UPI00129C0EFF|nr:cytochrome c [Endozoicomonas sp. OPT23]MRI32060.1 cytochrome C biogenesis protein CcsB [Endozoicomonas sp. OPT23]